MRLTELVIATHNAGKQREIADLLAPLGIAVSSAGDHQLPEPVEDGDSFIANARIKSLAAAQATGLPSLADDSGLVIPALNGAPGIYSARWAGEDKDFNRAMQHIKRELEATGEPEGQPAHFICVLALDWPDGRHVHFEGIVEGNLTFPPRGGKGFGYDPIFIPTGESRTFAEMETTEKHAMSHRADAFRQLMHYLERE